LVVGLAGLLAFVLIIEDELEKLSVVYSNSQTVEIAGNRAIRTVKSAVNNFLKA
jgi:hypothetical protein